MSIVNLRRTRQCRDSPGDKSAPARGQAEEEEFLRRFGSRRGGTASGGIGCGGCRGSCSQCGTTLVREIPGQEWLDVFRRLPAGRRTTFQVPRQPPSRIEFPMGQRGQQRKHRRCQPSAPQGPRAVEVLPRHGRAARGLVRFSANLRFFTVTRWPKTRTCPLSGRRGTVPAWPGLSPASRSEGPEAWHS